MKSILGYVNGCELFSTKEQVKSTWSLKRNRSVSCEISGAVCHTSEQGCMNHIQVSSSVNIPIVGRMLTYSKRVLFIYSNKIKVWRQIGKLMRAEHCHGRGEVSLQ